MIATEGSPEPLGVSPSARGVNVAIFSAHATAIEFCLFDEAGEKEVARIRLPGRTGDIWHGFIDGVGEGARYGLRAHGPFAPEQGHRFNPSKLLIDPHARLLDRPSKLHPSMFGYPEGGTDLDFDATDSAPFMPKCVVMAQASAATHRPLVPWSDTILYELHVKGFTRRHPHVPPVTQGTFAGLSHPAAIDHLTKLGVTSAEILPAAAWIEERHLAGLGLTNYWGYNPVALAAPEPRLAPGGWAEVRAAVAALAEAGIETIVDVVLNHSGEGDALGPTLSLRGLDNASYYRLHPDDPRRYIDDSGCGNTLALHRAPVVRMVMDSLRTWVRQAGVHGFRFDLATCMGRRPDGFDPEAPLLAAMGQDPELSGLKLIAEAWDIGPGGYQVGSFPAGWGEWNDRYRDDVRQFWRGDRHRLGGLATRLAGSADIFGPNRPPSRSVNFLTAHDGFALADLVSHETKKNHANGENNRDGSDSNHSWNNGCEGATDDPAIRAARLRDQKALLATLLFARGTPMLSMGAELGHSQGGNNNCYAQDNELSWLDWEGADEELLAFTQAATALRKAHPLLRRDKVLEEGEATWLTPEGKPMHPGDWDQPDAGSLTMVLEGEHRIAILIHRGREERDFTLPPGDWTILLNSADATPSPFRGRVGEGGCHVQPRSVLVLAEEKQTTRATTDTLATLATAAGIQPDWWSIDGQRHEVSEDTKRHLLAAMRLPAGSEGEARDSLARLSAQTALRPLPAATVRREGEPTEIELVFEPGLRRPVLLTVDGTDIRILSLPEEQVPFRAPDGRRAERRRVILPPLPAGRYTLRRDDAPDCTGRLTIAPRRAWLPESIARGGKLWGIAAQLYTLRRLGDGGIGDLTTLSELARAAAGAGAAAVGINPLHALFPEQRDRASPYSPSDRRFLDPIYLDVGEGGGGGDLVDYPAVWRSKEATLRRMFVADAGEGPDAWITGRGEALRTFATFSALSRRHEGPWQNWPSELRDPSSPAVRAFAEAEANELRFQSWLQWQCEQQLAAAADAASGMEIGLYRDLAIGAAPDGAEAWANQSLLARGVSIGAPPDPLGPTGQVWNLPPPDPHALAACGYDPFAELLRANMAHAGALRIDHAIGLARLFWVPEGAQGSDGAYVTYPCRDLIGEAALASQEARCMVVGEDLGTVPEGFRETLSDAGMLGYRVALLEREGAAFRDPAAYPHLSLACVASHDLPPLAGWWTGHDISERVEAGQLADAEADGARAEREGEKQALLAATGVSEEDVIPRAHAWLAAGESALVMVQADDLAGETVSVNLPGTDTERPNWRRRLGVEVGELTRSSILDAVREVR